MAKQVTMTIKGLDKFISNLDNIDGKVKSRLQEAVNEAALFATDEIKAVTPVAKRQLVRSIRPEFGVLRAVISPNTKYAIFVHEGTRPHIIMPLKKQALYWKGALHPVRRVLHPGTKAQPFLETGMTNAKEGVIQIFEKKLNQILRDISIGT